MARDEQRLGKGKGKRPGRHGGGAGAGLAWATEQQVGSKRLKGRGGHNTSVKGGSESAGRCLTLGAGGAQYGHVNSQ